MKRKQGEIVTPNCWQKLSIKLYFKTHKTLIEKAQSREHYLVVDMITHKFYFSTRFIWVETEISELLGIGFKLVVVNNIIFIW